MSDTFASFDISKNPKMKPARDQVMAVARGDAWCALLCGQYGNGKTHLAIAAMNEIGLNRSYFWKVPDFLAWVKRRAFEEGEPLESLLHGYMTGVFLLVFDDLGAENQTDWAAEQLYRVLDSRYDSRLPTIITSNQPPTALDGRINSRFSEGRIVCVGRDMRDPR